MPNDLEANLVEKTFDVMILGLNPQGLFLLREYSKAGYNTLGIGLKGQVGLFSKYGKKIAIGDLKELGSIFSRYLCDSINIHISSDLFINYVVEKHGKIFDSCRCFPQFESALLFRDKLLTEHFARSLSIPCPLSFRITDIDPCLYNKFPSIIKWNKTYETTSFKTIVIRSKDELINFYKKNIHNENLLIQKYIAGEPRADLSYGGYWINGFEKIGIVVSQKRQHPVGLSSFVEEYNGSYANQVVNIAKLLLEKTNYNGFVEVECRVDDKQKNVYLIEVNPRACGWIKIVREQFDNVLLKSRDDQINLGKKPLCWVNIARDCRAILNLCKTSHNKINVKEIITDYLRNPVKDIFEIDDLKPFAGQFLNFLIKDGSRKKQITSDSFRINLD